MGLEAASFISDLNTSNPLNTDTKSQGDDHIRLVKTVLQATLPGADLPFYISADRADVASAATTDIGAATTQYVNITGTTTITGLGTANAGVWRFIRFNAALTLTHNASSLVLPGAANITTVAGDHALAFSRGAGSWVIPWYSRASGASIETLAATTVLAGKVELAIASEMVTGTDAARVPSVSVMQNHEGVAKAWGSITNSGVVAVEDSYSVTGANRDAQGIVTVTLSVTMANDDYAVMVTLGEGGADDRTIRITDRTTTAFTVEIAEAGGGNRDQHFMFVVFGTLA